jgi:HAD superfamily phosphatase (TIGR01668 family)
MFWRLFIPDRYVESITEVEVVELRERGIEGIILDLDNTLVVRDTLEMEEGIRAWLERAKGVRLKLCINSNSDQRDRVQAIGRELAIPQLAWASKPRRWGFRRAMQVMGTLPQATAVIGDQLLTDVLGGNRLGLYTILVRPLSGDEFLTTRLNRRLERWLLRILKIEV